MIKEYVGLYSEALTIVGTPRVHFLGTACGMRQERNGYMSFRVQI